MGDQARDFEISVIRWCLGHGAEFGYLVRQLRRRLFQDPSAQAVWPQLLDCWERHQAWPTQSEAFTLVEDRLRNDPNRPAHQQFLLECYEAPVSNITGEELRAWVVRQELAELGASLQQTAMGLTGLGEVERAEVIAEARLEFEKVLRVAEGVDDTIAGEDFEPLSDDSLLNLGLQLEEDWGAPPLPTGFARLDAKLKDGGIRPYGVLIFGPTGGGKTMFAINVAMHAVSLGKRGVYFSFDDHKMDLRDRILSHMLCEEVELETLQRIGAMEATMRDLKWVRDECFPGRLIVRSLDPEVYTPTDLLQMLERTQRKLAAEDMRAGKPEESWGRIDFVVVDTADQVRPDRTYKSEWYEVGKTHQTLNLIPKRFHCPLFSIVQGGQQTVGAAQLTERDVGEGYAKTKPYKLILGVAQTHIQYQSDQVVSVSDPLVRDNLHNLHNYSIDQDRNTKWKPFSLCIPKNTRGSSRGGGAANKVKLPMLIHYGSCRVIEDYTVPETSLSAPLQTQRDVVEATGEPTIRRKRKVVKQ